MGIICLRYKSVVEKYFSQFVNSIYPNLWMVLPFNCQLSIINCQLSKVDAIFFTNPLDCLGRQYLRGGLHTKLHKVHVILLEPTPEGRATDSSRICKFGLIHTFHNPFIFLQSYGKILTFASLSLIIFSDCFRRFQRSAKLSYLCSV